MKTADAVVIGAGVNGASTAYNLAKRGLRKIVLLEKYLLASGGTGRSAAIIRQHYSNEELVKMVKRSVDIFRNFDDAVGGECGFVGCGWAFLIPENVSEGFTQNLTMQQRLGVRTKEISRAELLGIEPRLDLSDVHRIAYEPDSGYADPHLTTYAYIHKLRELGGDLIQMTAAQGLMLQGGSVKGVRTSAGDISSEIVVNAAGPWASVVGQWAGLDVPLRVTREEEVVLEAEEADGPPKLVFSDMAKAIYFRPDGRTRTLLGRGFPKPYEYVDPDRYKEAADTGFIEEATERLIQRLPAFEKAVLINAYTGLYDVTPDWHPILGKVDEVKGFYMCAGFSGHGFKTAPALGELLAEEIVDGNASSVDLSRFGLARFKSGDLFKAAYGGNRA